MRQETWAEFGLLKELEFYPESNGEPLNDFE